MVDKADLEELMNDAERRRRNVMRNIKDVAYRRNSGSSFNPKQWHSVPTAQRRPGGIPETMRGQDRMSYRRVSPPVENKRGASHDNRNLPPKPAQSITEETAPSSYENPPETKLRGADELASFSSSPSSPFNLDLDLVTPHLRRIRSNYSKIKELSERIVKLSDELKKITNVRDGGAGIGEIAFYKLKDVLGLSHSRPPLEVFKELSDKMNALAFVSSQEANTSTELVNRLRKYLDGRIRELQSLDKLVDKAGNMLSRGVSNYNRHFNKDYSVVSPDGRIDYEGILKVINEERAVNDLAEVSAVGREKFNFLVNIINSAYNLERISTRSEDLSSMIAMKATLMSTHLGTTYEVYARAIDKREYMPKASDALHKTFTEVTELNTIISEGVEKLAELINDNAFEESSNIIPQGYIGNALMGYK